MEYKVTLQNSETEKIYDITSLCGEITVEFFMTGQPGKFSTLLQKDPNGILEIKNGSLIKFEVDGYGVFFGNVFTMGTDATETYKITAYDQMRYLKNEEIYITKDLTASGIFKTICEEAGMKYEIRHVTDYVIEKFRHDKKSRYAIIEYGIQKHLINRNELCMIRDDFGTLVFTELQKEKSNFIIGHESLLINYIYEISIDSDTFNEVKMYREDKKAGKRDVWVAWSSKTQKKWGKLRMLEEAKKDTNESKIIETAKMILKQKNRETETMKLNCLGIKEFKGGTGFILDLPTLKIREWMWVDSVTHTYSNDFHTMEMSVFMAKEYDPDENYEVSKK